MDAETTEVDALNTGVARAAAVKRDISNSARMERIEKKLDEILARMGAQVERKLKS